MPIRWPDPHNGHVPCRSLLREFCYNSTYIAPVFHACKEIVEGLNDMLYSVINTVSASR
jgi:hypothetical protein